MSLTVVFAVSGFLVCVVLWAKIWEIKTNRKPFVLRLISLGDDGLHNLTHKGAEHYSVYKAKLGVYLTRQLPLHTKSLYNRASEAIKTVADDKIKLLKDKGLIKNSEGMSEFFKNMDKETGSLEDDKKVE